MAAGLPIVSNRVGGVPEILEEGVTGIMVEPRNPQAMANALSGSLNDADLRRRLGVAAQARAASAHTPGAYRRTLVEFYQKTLRSLPR
jgi:glycosyltransferase involved in cell wall biosynthesis